MLISKLLFLKHPRSFGFFHFLSILLSSVKYNQPQLCTLQNTWSSNLRLIRFIGCRNPLLFFIRHLLFCMPAHVLPYFSKLVAKWIYFHYIFRYGHIFNHLFLSFYCYYFLRQLSYLFFQESTHLLFILQCY